MKKGFNLYRLYTFVIFLLISGQCLAGQHIQGSSRVNKYEKESYFLYGAEHLGLSQYYFDIPVVYNKDVQMWMNYFLTRGRNFFERYATRAGRYAPVLGKILEENGMPRDLIFLAMAESGFNNKAKSWAKAVGPWQFMPYTGKRYGLKIDWYVDERRDPIKSTVAASEYLTKLYNEFHSWELAAAAYNAGEGKIARAIRRYKTDNFWKLKKGRYLKRETKNYVPKIMALAILGKNLSHFGFEDIDFDQPLDFDEIVLPAGIDLYKIAKAIDVSFEELHYLNPELRRWFTPFNMVSYRLRVPPGYAQRWENFKNRIADFRATDFQTYRVRRSGSTLKDVAKKVKVADYVLETLNQIPKRHRLKRGQLVLLPFRIGQSRREPMYADLYERPRKSVLRRRAWKRRLKRALRRGKRIKSPTLFYTVKKGDSLWSIARRTGTSLDTIIASNYSLIKRRPIRRGDRLILR